MFNLFILADMIKLNHMELISAPLLVSANKKFFLVITKGVLYRFPLGNTLSSSSFAFWCSASNIDSSFSFRIDSSSWILLWLFFAAFSIFKTLSYWFKNQNACLKEGLSSSNFSFSLVDKPLFVIFLYKASLDFSASSNFRLFFLLI